MRIWNHLLQHICKNIQKPGGGKYFLMALHVYGFNSIYYSNVSTFSKLLDLESMLNLVNDFFFGKIK